ncbi:MAG TPA: glycosyltransferase N-terminal domain-containing protein [Williamwhitmania sp.]|nr:glycosyltransferase N-terminal domain-containing protein [Williamwhitmania sp.]
MVFLYTLGIRLYIVLVNIAAPFNPKAKLWLKGRRNLFARLSASIHKDDRIAWFHCASLGEFEQGRPVIEGFRAKHPDFKILVTFFSPSGYEVRKDYSGADFIFYLPIDTWNNARKFVQIVHPEVVFFVKYEFWYFMLNRLKKEGVKLYLISALFRPDQLFFKRYGMWYRRMLKCFTHIFVQNEQSESLLLSIGYSHVSVSGDTRFDRVNQIVSKAKELPLINSFKSGKTTLVAGSTWPKDEELIAQWFRQSNSKVKLTIAPHEIDENHIQSIIQLFNGINVARYTQATEQEASTAQVLIIDTIGILSSVYRYGELAYIGGGFGAGIHNTLEAATWGIPVIFGPRYQKFKEANDLIIGGGGFSISGLPDLTSTFEMLLNQPEKLQQCSLFARTYVEMKQGSTERILNSISIS